MSNSNNRKFGSTGILPTIGTTYVLILFFGCFTVTVLIVTSLGWSLQSLSKYRNPVVVSNNVSSGDGDSGGGYINVTALLPFDQVPNATGIIKEQGTSKVQPLVFDNDTVDEGSFDPLPILNTTINSNGVNIKHTAMRKAIQEFVDMLEAYYGGTNQTKNMMFQSWLSPWDVTSSDNKLVDTMVRAIVSQKQDEFIIGIIGSSVAAGNDNCYYDSYPSQLERTLGPIWEAGGMKLTVENTGAGQCGDTFSNQVFCVKQNISPNSDIIQYTYTYYEEGVKDEALASRESLVRWTQLLPHQPPVHVLNVIGLPNSNDTVYSKEYALAEHYSEHGYNAFYSKLGLINGGFDYESALKNGTNHFAPGYVGDGYHNITRYGEGEEEEGRRESLGVSMRNWHPGPLHNQFIADTFAYVYSTAALKALDLIEDEMNSPRDGVTLSSSKSKEKESHFPEPMFCDPLYCQVSEPPECTNFGKPVFGEPGATIEEEPWNYTRMEMDMKLFVPKVDQAFFQDKNYTDTCQHLFECGGASIRNGTMVFRLPKSNIGLLIVCGVGRREVKVGNDMFLNNTGIEMSYNGQVLDRTTWDVYPDQKCVRVMKRRSTTALNHTLDSDYLTIKALNHSNPVWISQVITL